MSSPSHHLNGTPRHLTHGGIAGRAILWAVIFLAIGVGGDYIADHFGLQHDLIYVNDVLSTVVIAGLVVVYERRRRKRIEERLEIIAQMNHHVRNALQLISLSPHAKEREENVALIQQAVERIEWALREVLPGPDAVVANGDQEANQRLRATPRPTR